MPPKKELQNYLKEFIASDEAKSIIASSKVINGEGFDIWSLKKLIFLEYYIKPYLSILSDKYKSRCYFIDFFSSCGANKTEGDNLISIGSPIVSLLNGVIPNKSKGINNRFFKWIFLEFNSEFCNALEKRVEKTCEIIKEKTGENLILNKDIEIIQGDSNVSINNLVTQLDTEAKNEKIAVLAFIDPYKFSAIEWETIKKLLTLKYVDVIFTLPTGTLRRGADICKNKDKFLSPSLLKACLGKKFCEIPEENISKLYAKDISEVVCRDINFFDKGISVRNTTNAELYKIELFSHSKKAVEIGEGIAKKLDKITCNDLNQMVYQAKGKQKTLF
jgi:three-Cys-motif partner protein